MEQRGRTSEVVLGVRMGLKCEAEVIHHPHLGDGPGGESGPGDFNQRHHNHPQPTVVSGTATDRQRQALRADKKGEMVSPLFLPEYRFYAALSDEERRSHMRQLLALDEGQALAIVVPVFKAFRNFADVFSVYKSMIEELKIHFCRPGRRRQGKPTWAEIVNEYFGVSLRRMQQLLAIPKNTEDETSAPEESWDSTAEPAGPTLSGRDEESLRRIAAEIDKLLQPIDDPVEYARLLLFLQEEVITRRTWPQHRIQVRIRAVKDRSRKGKAGSAPKMLTNLIQ